MTLRVHTYCSRLMRQRCVGPDSLFETLRNLYIVTPIVVGSSTIAFVFMIRRLYIDFGWAVFHLVSASPQMKRELNAFCPETVIDANARYAPRVSDLIVAFKNGVFLRYRLLPGRELCRKNIAQSNS